MQGKEKRRARRLRKVIFMFAIAALVLTGATYAWFIGMQTVNVSSFDVEIKSTDSLLLSFNGIDWGYELEISKDKLDDVSYSGHTNNWGGKGLIPMSSIGELDSVASRMKIFEKASLTATTGGYRLMASRVNNHVAGDPERDGYVVFDLFVKNFSGTQYIANLEELDEEAIYLTTNSAVTVASDGVANTGIENSVRVAFAQIGRVIGTTSTPKNITGITCNSGFICTGGDSAPETSETCTAAGGTWTNEECVGSTQTYCDNVGGTLSQITGICRTAQIWEPNDDVHVASALKWYNTACKTRTVDSETHVSTYAGACKTLNATTAYDTYAVKTDITSADKVDIYDGEDYNGYEGSAKLYAYDYFTDTEKDQTGMERPTFMTLAPNSITKIRIYIYIEGQDIDNYDFASIGKKISVNFGFTKERFIESDLPYDGPDIRQAVTFNADGGTPAPKAQQVITGAVVVRPQDPTKEGFTFNHWTKEGEEIPYDFTRPVLEDITLVAKYTQN